MKIRNLTPKQAMAYSTIIENKYKTNACKNCQLRCKKNDKICYLNYLQFKNLKKPLPQLLADLEEEYLNQEIDLDKL